MSVHSPNEHICKLCNKYYKSRQSLWNHTNNYHNTKVTISNPKVTQQSPESNPKVTQISPENDTNKLCCKNCNKEFKFKQGKWRHEQICNKKEKNKETELLESKINAMSQQIAQILNEKAKIHPKTLQKINKNLINNINNGTVINNTFVKFGKVELSSILNTKEILSILNQPFISIEETTKLKI